MKWVLVWFCRGAQKTHRVRTPNAPTALTQGRFPTVTHPLQHVRSTLHTQVLNGRRIAASAVDRARPVIDRARPVVVRWLVTALLGVVLGLAVLRHLLARSRRRVASGAATIASSGTVLRVRSVVSAWNVSPQMRRTALACATAWREYAPDGLVALLGLAMTATVRRRAAVRPALKRWLTLALVGTGLGIGAVALGGVSAHAATSTTTTPTTKATTTKATTTKATTTKATSTKVAAAKPAATKPVVGVKAGAVAGATAGTAKSTTTKPATTKPATTKPATTKPATATKTTSKPATTKPTTTTKATATKVTTAKATTAKPATTTKATTTKVATPAAKPTTTKPGPAKVSTVTAVAGAKAGATVGATTGTTKVAPPKVASTKASTTAPKATPPKAAATTQSVGVKAGVAPGVTTGVKAGTSSSTTTPKAPSPKPGLVTKVKNWLTKPYQPIVTTKVKEVAPKVRDSLTMKDVQPISKTQWTKPQVPVPATQPAIRFTPKPTAYTPCVRVDCSVLGSRPSVLITSGPVKVSGVPNGKVSVPYQRKVTVPVDAQTYTVNGKPVTVQPKPVTVTVGGAKTTIPSPNAMIDTVTANAWSDKVPFSKDRPPYAKPPTAIDRILIKPTVKPAPFRLTDPAFVPAPSTQKSTATRTAAKKAIPQSSINAQVDTYGAQQGWTKGQTTRVKAMVTQELYKQTLGQVTTQQKAAETATKPSLALVKAIAASDAKVTKASAKLTPEQTKTKLSQARVTVVTSAAAKGIEGSSVSKLQRDAAAEQVLRKEIIKLVPTSDVRKAAEQLAKEQKLTPGMTKSLVKQMITESVTVTANGDPRNRDSIGVVTAQRRADEQAAVVITAVNWNTVTKIATDRARAKNLSKADTAKAVQAAKNAAFTNAYTLASAAQAELDRLAKAARQGSLDPKIPAANTPLSVAKLTPAQQLQAYKDWREKNLGPQLCSGGLYAKPVGGMFFACRNKANNDQLNVTTIQAGVSLGQLTEVYPAQRRPGAPAEGVGGFIGGGTAFLGGSVGMEFRDKGVVAFNAEAEGGVLPWISVTGAQGKVVDPTNGNLTITRAAVAANKSGYGWITVTNAKTGQVIAMNATNGGFDTGTVVTMKDGKVMLKDPVTAPADVVKAYRDLKTVAGAKMSNSSVPLGEDGKPKKAAIWFASLYGTKNVWDTPPTCGKVPGRCWDPNAVQKQQSYERKLAATKAEAAEFDAATQDVVDARLRIAYQRTSPGTPVPSTVKLRADYAARTTGVDTSASSYQNGGWKQTATSLGYRTEASALDSAGYATPQPVPGKGVTLSTIPKPGVAALTMPEYPKYDNPALNVGSVHMQ